MITGRKRPCKVLFQTFTTVSGQHEDVKTWVEHAQPWVSIDPVRGNEKHIADELESKTTHVVRGDWQELKAIDATMRMIYDPDLMNYDGSPAAPNNAQVYEILAVMPDENNHSDVMIRVEKEGRNYGKITG